MFEAPKFGRGYVGQHALRIVGFPVIDEISIWYEIAAAKPLTIEVGQGGVRRRKRRSTTPGFSTRPTASRITAASSANA